MREHRPVGENAAPSPGFSPDLPYGRVKAEMGEAFGTDFSGVSIAHDGAAEALGAQAFAQGESIHLAAGKGDPATDEGRALLGHELAHVVQQRDGRVGGDEAQGKDAPVVADPDLEREADVAGAAAARGEAVPAVSRAGAGIQAKAEGAPIQKFDTEEHKETGDAGSKGLSKGYDAEKPGKLKVHLTHGDLVAISGDFFDPRDTDENGKPIPDSLFRLAATPSSSPGNKPGTQDEILYALKTYNDGDKRFEKGGVWANVKFSDEVVKAVESRYLKLAAKNDEHFQHPNGPGSGGPSSGNRASGGGSYRALHEDACLRAHRAKAEGKTVDEAMAREAAAQHFLTDGFAAGHARTPRASIRTHWQDKYPLFFDNLKKAIAHETAIWINDNNSGWATDLGTVGMIMDSILAEVEKATKTMPALGFDDLVSLAVHDTDNERGLWVTNDLGDAWQTFGDHSFAKGETAKHCNQAVRLGCQDIQHAYAINESKDDDAILADVRARTPAPAKAADKYGPEQALPVLDPKRVADNGTQTWQAESFEALWKQPVRSDSPTETFASVLTASVTGGELNKSLSAMANKFPETQVSMGTTLTPRRGYNEGFLNPLIADPYAGLRRILHYDPTRGMLWKDNAVFADLQRLDDKDAAAGKTGHESMRGLTVEQRVVNCKQFLGWDTTVAEQERVAQMFETTRSNADARAVYQGIEGRAWSGDFVRGFLVSDDYLWGMNPTFRERVKTVLNGK